MSLLRIDDLHVNYGAVRGLRGISIDVKEGDLVSLLGGNGAGKSTTLKAISGMVRPAKGYIEYQGERLTGKWPNQIIRMGIAHVPEGRKIFKDLKVIENLNMGAYTRNDRAGIQEDLEMIYELFPRLKERHNQLGGSLSGGEQQMLAIGRGLMARPKVLLLDEPSLGLAPNLVADIFRTLLTINAERGTTMLIVEQNVRIALKHTRYAYVLQVGKIAVEGLAQELSRDKQVIESYMGVQEEEAS